MRFVSANGVGLHWRQDGDPGGPALVFANSLGTDLRLWDRVVAQMPGNLRLIRYDMRGHGLSDVPVDPFDIDDLTNDILSLLDHLGIETCGFVGTSLGGMIGQNLAARRPGLVRGLVLTNTAAKMGNPTLWADRIKQVEDHGLGPIADDVLTRWFSPAFLVRPEARAWRNMLIQTSAKGYAGCCEAIAKADLTAATASLLPPVCVVAGSADRASPPGVVKAMADLIPGAKFHTLDGVGHLPSVEAPDALSCLITHAIKETENA